MSKNFKDYIYSLVLKISFYCLCIGIFKIFQTYYKGIALIVKDIPYNFLIFFAISLLCIIVAIVIKYLKYHIINNISLIVLIFAFLFFEDSLIFWILLITGIFVLFYCEDVPFVHNLIKKVKKYSCCNEKIENKQNILADEPLSENDKDELGRDNFVIYFLNSLFTPSNESRTIILSGKWGEGKTSCVNLLKYTLKNIKKEETNKEEIIHSLKYYNLVDINPWFNDTKEKMMNALFGEINDFAKTHFPFKSLEQEFDDVAKLSKVKVGYFELSLDTFTKDKNIQNKIKEIGNVLSKYKERLVVCIDDIDRLDKKHILSIIQTVKMFAEYTNIIFLLIMNLEKVEQIICETSSYNNGEKNNVQCLCYKGYVEKIASVVIGLPKVEPYYIEKYLLGQINVILKNLGKNIIEENDFYWYISTRRFKNIRDVKRFCNVFYLSYLQVKNTVNVFNYINITILFLFYNDLYDEAWQNQSLWFSKGQLEQDIEYFEKLKKKHNDDYVLDELLYLLSPNYSSIGINKLRNEESQSYFLDSRYLCFYFTHNFSKNTISDEILDSMIANCIKEENEGKRELLINQFLDNYKDKFIDIFKYINIKIKENYLKDNILLYKQIIILFSKKSFNLLMGKSPEESVEHIQNIVSVFDSKNDINKFDFFTKIIKESSSVTFAIEMYTKIHGIYIGSKKLQTDIIEKNIDEKISYDVEKALNDFSKDERYLYIWLREYFLKDINKITDLTSEEYHKLRDKIGVVYKFIKNNFEYFWVFIGKELLKSFKTQHDFGNIVFFMDLWGKEHILEMIENFSEQKGLTLQNKQEISELHNLIKTMDNTTNVKIDQHKIELLNKLVLLDLCSALGLKNIERHNDYYSCNINEQRNKKDYIIKIVHVNDIEKINIDQNIKSIRMIKNDQEIAEASSFGIKTIFCLYFIAYNDTISKEINHIVNDIKDDGIEFRIKTIEYLENQF